MDRLPVRYSQTFDFDSDKGYLGVWQPLSKSGLNLLSRGPKLVYGLCDGKHSLAQITQELKKIDKSVTPTHISKILRDLEKQELISWEYPPKLETEIEFPNTLGVWIHTTNQCNLRCTYCYVHKTNEPMAEATAKKAVDRVLISAKNHGFSKVKFKYSGGEALLRFNQVIEQIKYAKSKANEVGIKVENVILTNAVLSSAPFLRH